MAEKSMEDVIAKIRECAEQLTSLADSLEPKKTRTDISFTDLRGRLADKSRAGYTEQIRELIRKHGAERLSDLDENEYAGLLTEVEALA